MSTHIFGIRHHGPGSARHLVQALEAVKPDIILVEGPPEAEPLVKWCASEEMVPPVAILAYIPDNPRCALFYPFTHYSPEWQAISYALANRIPLRFIDMPLQHTLALRAASETPDKEEETAVEESKVTDETVANPMSYLASLAGYDDEEEWWEQFFELSHEDPLLLFDSVRQAVKALREQLPQNEKPVDLQREVFMRRYIQQAENEMFTSIAVVCGAWHAPALEQRFTQKQERELVRELPKIKTECCWIPWTNSRLMYEDGYGAGILSPGWYEHQWFRPDDDGTTWLTLTAQTFRRQKMDISSAHVIETLRLARALTQIRGLRHTGLKEYTEATQTVMCMGDCLPLALLKKELIVGNRLGAIPADTPQSPLQYDFEKRLKSLRLKVSEDTQIVSLDLRKSLDLQKSIFLHRLEVLDVGWGRKELVSSKGTFREEWRLCWKPEMLIELIAKSAMGNTIESAANAYMQEKTTHENELRVVSVWLKQAIPAELSQAIDTLLVKIDTLAASASDVEALIASLLPLSEILKYGDVRRSDKSKVYTIFRTIFYRTVVGLPVGCTGINDEQASLLVQHIYDLNKVIMVLDDDAFTTDWNATLARLSRQGNVAPFVSGAVLKLCYEGQLLPAEEISLAFHQALSVGVDISDSACWLEGFLHDAATILLHDDGIWLTICQWVASLDSDTFTGLLPLLRRTFSSYSSPEKDKLAQKVKLGSSGFAGKSQNPAVSTNLLSEQLLPLVPTIEHLLGL